MADGSTMDERMSGSDRLAEVLRSTHAEFMRRFAEFERRHDERMDFLTRVLGEHARRIKDLEDARQ